MAPKVIDKKAVLKGKGSMVKTKTAKVNTAMVKAKAAKLKAKAQRKGNAKAGAQSKTAALVKKSASIGRGAAGETIAQAFMRSAAMSALAGVRLGHGGPFGATIVRDGVIIACAHNMVLHMCNPSRHAEVNAIQQACKALGSHDLSECDLYTTCEPCPMSWGAVQWSRLGKVYIGADRHTAAKYGFDGVTQQVAAQNGFEDGIAHFKGLMDGRKFTHVVEGVAVKECEAVFAEWSDRNGVIG